MYSTEMFSAVVIGCSRHVSQASAGNTCAVCFAAVTVILRSAI